MTGKQRAALRKASMGINTVFQVGKDGIDEMVVKATKDCLNARELIKLKTLETTEDTAKEVASNLAQATGSQVIYVRGRSFVLFLRKKKNSAFAEIFK